MMETTLWTDEISGIDGMIRVDAAVTVGGRLFQALVPAAEKDRSLSVDLRVAGTTNADELEDLRRCRDAMWNYYLQKAQLSGVVEDFAKSLKLMWNYTAE